MFRGSRKIRVSHDRRQYGLRFFSTPLKTCIVGTGPSAFYTAKYLLKKVPEATVTFLDMFPTPFGLVRYGVAPDHEKTKNCINDFTSVLEDERVSFFGNVEVGKDISVKQLRENFNAVVLAYGASSDRDFGIPGENGNNILSARRFVNWYNGHPHYSDLDFEFKGKTAVILGQGNVAIDCARIIGSPLDRLVTTDICSHATEKLKASEINKIHLIGRRGPVQIAATSKELREIVYQIDGLQGVIHEHDFQLTKTCQEEKAKIRGLKRKIDIFDKAAKEIDETKRNIIFDFYLQPVKFELNDENFVTGVTLEKCKLEGEMGKQKSIPTGEFQTIEADLVLKSIGYKGLTTDSDIPFDEKSGTIISSNGKIENGFYCAGWIKRGPSGVFMTNIPDATETVNSIVEDWENSNLPKIDNKELHFDESKVVPKEGWFHLNQIEIENGEKIGKPREKLLNVDEMVSLSNKKLGMC